jgi:alpha-1,3-rhamnosyl/mannosyltransferase
MAQLCRRHGGTAPADLVLAGYQGWISNAMVAPTDLAILGANLRELGRISDEQLWALYAGATVFAFPSLHEGFGLPVVEALSQGTALVCSDIPVLREVAGSAALYVSPTDVQAWADAIDSLLTDDHARRLLEESGPPRSSRFTAQRQLEGTHAVYREAAGSAD